MEVNALNMLSQLQHPAAKAAKERLGKDDFLKLLMAQVKNQDPMALMKDNEFIAQLAQFRSLESLQNLNKNFEAIIKFSQLSQSAGLIGHTVALNSQGNMVSGLVTSIKMVDGEPLLNVGGNTFSFSDVKEILQ